MSHSPSGRLRQTAAVVGLFAVALGLATAGATRLFRYGVDGPVSNPTDFRSYYCAGAALAAGRDPYRVEPMRSCQRESLASNGLQTDPHLLYPAPLPPYALGAFSLVARMPFRAATEVWLGLLFVATGLTVVGVVGLSGARPVVVGLALFASVGFTSFMYGQLVPLVLAALVLAALFARRGDGRSAALCLIVASLEPHVALAGWLGLGLFFPRSRAPLAIGAAAVAVSSLAFGLALNLEYFTVVLPQHARSELYDFPCQYSLASVLALAGVPARAALAAGSVSYGAMLALGLALGERLRRRTGDAAFLITAPIAAVLVGGPYIHIDQMGAAIPFGLMLLARIPKWSLAYVVAFVAIIALAIPWGFVATMPQIADRLPFKAIGAAPPLAPMTADESLEVPYTAYIDAFAERADPRTPGQQTAWKVPTWCALLMLLGISLGARASTVEAGSALRRATVEIGARAETAAR